MNLQRIAIVLTATTATMLPATGQDGIVGALDFHIDAGRFNSVVRSDMFLKELMNADAGAVQATAFAATEMTGLQVSIQNWISAQYQKSGATGGYFIGKFSNDRFGPLSGQRVTIIVPSEVFRDARDEWDKFDLLIAVEPSGEITVASVAATRHRVWISTENYRRRARGVFSVGGEPSPDWEYTALADGDTTNARLTLIADTLKGLADEPVTAAVAQ